MNNMPMVKDLPVAERPREKLLAKGAQSLNNAELLAILLRTGTKEDSVLHVAEKLLAQYKERGLASIVNLSPHEFSKIKGIGTVKAVTVLAAIELGRRLAEQTAELRTVIEKPRDIVDYVMPRFRYETKEYFIVMLLNTKHHVLAVHTVSIGSLSASIVHPREVFREAMYHAAAAIVLIHNHPSGDPSPSKEDICVTRKLIQTGVIMDIPVLDHIIIGDNKYVSLKEKGMIE
ncbi:DNA repair protein RadC [Propionispira arboris]|uniref:DNA repair protein RadC n=1 Tax=Propionispira arboris TaxID=84035 RepID=A0A1H7CNK6_9FIRM|nr:MULTISPECIES: DNA repair protein RadC [Propionispira]SEJ91219.1 DNA repair protein RadC [Propionispira arboris]